MNHPVAFIRVPLTTWLPLLGGGILLLAAIAALGAYNKHSRAKQHALAERDWSIPTVDRFTGLDSPFHRWDPRIKIAAAIVYWFCLASLTRAPLIGVTLVISLATVVAAKVPLAAALKRVAALAGFLGMFMLVMPLTVTAKPGDSIFTPEPFTFLQFNLRGFLLALRIGGKASAIALMMDPIFGTSPFAATMEGVAGIGVPRKVCEMLMLVHRYIFVFQNEAKRMLTGMRVRGFSPGTNLDTLASTGSFLGMLFVRSFERTEGVYEAMLARGYQDKFPGHPELHALTKDWLLGSFWVVLGLLLVAVNQLGLPLSR